MPNQHTKRPKEPEHGTRSMYVWFGCRCAICREENAVYSWAYRKRAGGFLIHRPSRPLAARSKP